MPTTAARKPLPFLVIHTALGVLLKGRDYGVVKTMPRGELARAIQIATTQRQAAGQILPGTHTLSEGGKAWQRKVKRELGPDNVAAIEQEWERLVTLTHKKGATPAKPKANGLPAAVSTHRVLAEWSKAQRCWVFAVWDGNKVVARGHLLDDDLTASASDTVIAQRCAQALVDARFAFRGSTLAVKVDRPATKLTVERSASARQLVPASPRSRGAASRPTARKR